MAHGGDTWSYSRGRVASHTFLATVHALRRPEEDVGAAGVEPRTLAALATFAPEADRREGRIKPWPRRPSVLPLGFRADKAPMSRPARVRVGRRLDVAQGLSAWVGRVATRAETRFRAIWASDLPGVVGSVSSKEPAKFHIAEPPLQRRRGRARPRALVDGRAPAQLVPRTHGGAARAKPRRESRSASSQTPAERPRR